MSIIKLTRRTLAAIKPTDRRVVYYDKDTAGFAMRVEPSGRMTYFVEYRPGAGGRGVPKTRLTIGTTTQFSPEDARRRAAEVLASVRLGGNPADDRRRGRALPTVKDFAGRYLNEEAKAKLKPGSLRNYTSYLNKHIVPAIGTSKLDQVRTEEIARLHRDIGKRSPIVANRVVECLGSLFRYGAVCGLVPKGHNPAAGVSAFREQTRERFLSAEELARLGETLIVAETVGIPWKASTSKHTPQTNRHTIIDGYAVAAIRLLILTGLRLREVLHLRWEDIDFQHNVALLTDSKVGRRYVVINAPAVTVLQDLERIGDYVIAGSERLKPRADLNRPWRAVRAHAELEDARIHDLRHSFASVGVSGGIPLAIVGKLLGHRQASTTQRYAHLADDPVRAAAEVVGKRIAAAMSGHVDELKPLRERKAGAP